MYKTLSGLRLGKIGQGITGVGNKQSANTDSEKSRIHIIKYGIEEGLNFIDTAELYGGGYSEHIVGEAIKGKREDVFVATKCNVDNVTKQKIKIAFSESLRRLQVEYIDLYQIHWPNPYIPYAETIEVLRDFIYQGKLRYIGLSNHSLLQFKQAFLYCPDIIISNQLPYSLLQKNIFNDYLDFAKQNNKLLLAYSPFKYLAQYLSLLKNSKISELSIKYNRTWQELSLSWLLRQNNIIVLIKTGNLQHMKDNLAMLNFQIDEDDITSLEECFNGYRSKVNISKIRPPKIENEFSYSDVKAAIANINDSQPSAQLIADSLVKQKDESKILLLIKSKSSNNDGYVYELLDNSVYYWGYRIAYGESAIVPVYIINNN